MNISACSTKSWKRKSISLKCRKNVTAVMYSIGSVILLNGVFSMIGFALVNASGGEFGAFLAPFAPVTSITFLVHPRALFNTAKEFSEGAAAARAWALFGSAAATAGYTFIVWRVYNSLVRNFDMTLRKQSGL